MSPVNSSWSFDQRQESNIRFSGRSQTFFDYAQLSQDTGNTSAVTWMWLHYLQPFPLVVFISSCGQRRVSRTDAFQSQSFISWDCWGTMQAMCWLNLTVWKCQEHTNEKMKEKKHRRMVIKESTITLCKKKNRSTYQPRSWHPARIPWGRQFGYGVGLATITAR